MSIYVRCVARREAPVHRSCKNALLRQRQVSNKLNFFLICVSEKRHFSVSIFGRCVLCKMGPICILVTMGGGELVIICDHVNLIMFRINELKTASSLLKGRGCGKKIMTLKQEMSISERSCFLLTISYFSSWCG